MSHTMRRRLLPETCGRFAPGVIATSGERGCITNVVGADSEHHTAVTAWFQHVAQRRSVDSLIQAFENTFAAVWQRSCLVLGEVTLMAIVERVLHTATEQFPLLASVEVEATGLRCQSLRSQAGLRDEQVSAAVQFVLVEFLTVLGNLTAQILSPALHAELSKGPVNVADASTKDPAP